MKLWKTKPKASYAYSCLKTVYHFVYQTNFFFIFSHFLFSKNKKPLKFHDFNGLCGASRRTRTYNPSVNSRMLCHWAIEAKGGYYSTLLESGGDLLFRAVSSQVPSALKGLTSVFGMGTGGTPSPLPPEIVYLSIPHLDNCTSERRLFVSYVSFSLRPSSQSRWNQALDLLVSSSSIRYRTSTDDLSPGSLPGVLPHNEWEILS